MDYTHHYAVNDWHSREWKAAWRQLVKEVPLIIKRSGIEICGEVDKDSYIRPPMSHRKKGIYLNGVGNDGHEPLTIYPGWGAWFVKTAQKPYDVVVACVLLRAHMLAPSEFSVSSDGPWETGWDRPRILYTRVFPGQPISCPWWRRDSISEESVDRFDGLKKWVMFDWIKRWLFL